MFVEAHGLEFAAFYSCDLRTHQCGTVFEILGAILRECFELSIVGDQSLEMLPVLVGERGIAGPGMRKRSIEVILRGFKKNRRATKMPSLP